MFGITTVVYEWAFDGAVSTLWSGFSTKRSEGRVVSAGLLDGLDALQF